MTQPLEAGAQAPNFDLPADEGRVSLQGCAGNNLVLYFYPKDDTPGCTLEAKHFSQYQKDFEKAGTVVIGVSKDTPASHGKFKQKYDLTFALASDESGEICEAYGVWIEKSMYGKRYMGIDRATFLIDREGVIRRVWRKVKVEGHVEEVLAAAQALA